MVIIGLILGTLTTLQLFTTVVHLRAFHRFLANDTLSTSLKYPAIVLQCYVQFHVMTVMHGLSAQDTQLTLEHGVMPITVVSILLCIIRESPTGSLALRPAKGWLVICLLISWAVFEILCYLHTALFMCGTVAFVLDRSLSPVPISWHFSITIVRKASRAVYGVVRRAARKVWGYFARVVHWG